jgi:hypothetical protein
MTRYPSLTIRLPQDTIDWLKAEATLFDTSTANIVKRALDLYYETKYPLTD